MDVSRMMRMAKTAPMDWDEMVRGCYVDVVFVI